MSALTSVVKVMDGPLGTRFCFLSLLVFFCAIELVDALESSPTTDSIVLRRPGNLTREQLRSAVTIEFDFGRQNGQDAENVRREVRKKILEFLNRRKKSTVAATTANPSTTTYAIPTTTVPTSTVAITTTSAPSTTVTVTSTPVASTTTTAAPTTTPTTFAVETTAVASSTKRGDPEPAKRKKRNIGENSDTFTEEDVVVIGNGNIFNENGNMRITININEAAIGNLSELLNEVAGAFDKSGEFGASPVKINKGLPKESSQVEAPLSFNFWLPVLLASNAFLLIFIFIFVFNWRSRSKKRSAGELEREKLIPVFMV